MELMKKKPEYVMESREDVLYHDNYVETGADLFGFTKRVMVFNKTMQWLEVENDDIIVCYSDAGDLCLTGSDQVSQWQVNPPDEITTQGQNSRFVKKNADSQIGCALLPCFQFHLGQHPAAELDVTEANCDWQVCVFVKGRSGTPLLCGGWQNGAGRVSLDIAAALKIRGFNKQFAELHFAVGVWNPDPAARCSVTFKMHMPGRAAAISSLPVIRTLERAGRIVSAEPKLWEGIPLSAVFTDAEGRLISDERIKVFAEWNRETVPLALENGLWKTRLFDAAQGDFRVRIFTRGDFQLETYADVRVTDGHFITYDNVTKLLSRNNKPMGPLSGSYQGMVFVKDGDKNKIINGQEAWDNWDRTVPPGEHFLYWEGMTEAEFEERFAYLAQCGWNLLHLCQHYGNWGRLDAGGRISPHGAEQVAEYYRIAGRHSMHVLQALTHYPYGTPEQSDNAMVTVPFSRYLEND